jgi:hypothetical protein
MEKRVIYVIESYIESHGAFTSEHELQKHADSFSPDDKHLTCSVVIYRENSEEMIDGMQQLKDFRSKEADQ